MNLRVKTADKQVTLKAIGSDEKVADLCEKVGVSLDGNADIKLLKGFPPKPLELPGGLEAKLSDLGIVNGDSIIVNVQSPTKKKGVLLRQVVPSDNSCLFTAVNYCLSGMVTSEKNDLMREVIAGIILSDPNKYTAAILGKEPEDYKNWILDPSSWGGAIEVQILAEYFGIEITVLDTLSGLCTHFGENLGAGQRMILIFDGIHYDPLYLEGNNDGSSSGSRRTLFSKDDDEFILNSAKEFARKAKEAKQYTDVNNFALKCNDCFQKLKGQVDAQNHAKSTGHTNFGEI